MVTPTQFIRAAALKIGTVRLGADKTVAYADHDLEPVADAKCYLCGGVTGGLGWPTKKAILPTFTDRDKARRPDAQAICPGCALCLSHREMRNYSILATENGLSHPGRAETREILLSPPDGPWVLCIATSGQKHLHFKAMVNYSREDFAVQMEDLRVGVNRELFAEILAPIEQLYAVFSKAEIESGRYGQHRIKEFGMAEFSALENRIAVHRGQRQFGLAIFVAQKPPEPAEKEEEPPCTIISTPTTTAPQLALF